MKRFILVMCFMVSGMFLVSCMESEDTVEVVYKYRAIDSVQVELDFITGREADIYTYYTKQNKCEEFFNYDYLAIGNDRIVKAVVSEVVNNNCGEDSTIYSQVLKFKPKRPGVYSFYFLTGYDEETGSPVYLEEEIIIN